MSDVYLTLKEVADRIGLTVRQVRYLTEYPEGAYERLPVAGMEEGTNRLLISLEDVEEWEAKGIEIRSGPKGTPWQEKINQVVVFPEYSEITMVEARDALGLNNHYFKTYVLPNVTHKKKSGIYMINKASLVKWLQEQGLGSRIQQA